uniref:Uncharacterized protein n=1 Tax=Rhizophagus irregularis (strain DAOM 181602 / DAOM 197198 / MUCL 43194) TaxID=747089 RepID=U9TT75_RHIID
MTLKKLIMEVYRLIMTSFYFHYFWLDSLSPLLFSLFLMLGAQKIEKLTNLE